MIAQPGKNVPRRTTPRGRSKMPAAQASPAGGRAGANPGPGSAVVPANPSVSAEQRCVLISEAAYFLAEHRGFAPGHDLDDWLAAETEIDAILMRERAPDVERP